MFCQIITQYDIVEKNLIYQNAIFVYVLITQECCLDMHTLFVKAELRIILINRLLKAFRLNHYKMH